MKRQNLIGLLLCSLLFFGGFLIKGNLSLYFNIASLMIVAGGSAIAALLSFQLERLRIVLRVVRASYRSRLKSEAEIVDILINLAIKSRMEGILSLQQDENETSIHFLRRGLGCLVDNYEPQQIRDILNTEMYFFKLRREDSERVLRTIADFCPAFGIVGSVAGLIPMLAGIDDTGIILKTVPLALTSILYGLILPNFFFIPFAANLRERTNQELLLQKIIMEGIIAIESELNPTVLRTKLLSFLTPSDRKADLVPLSRIQERFHIRLDATEPDDRDEPQDRPGPAVF
ncbi:MotA/TolQ/ExbB proton channel [Desulfobulbus propionicus DSM 2032]|uniref:MotA/TolQ/ExbB proton channel n=1 Tax=Desulfobulbus propionicus (strain ATCC 33891 / DSM 2032 / VKM B-1956 / 1pr3) TaxID=577650 RepID=A0A7U3YNC1_DESPD|nr:MotA/TolQ/ExbB proton channel family protein [Desulfobulbus propionicus]ADW18543.1 MotA/TolQ/ExbB proton channel [Desulfobulbus propionicus DSM 2032]